VFIFEIVFKFRNRFERAINATTINISMIVIFIFKLIVAIAINLIFYANVSLANLVTIFHHRIVLRRRMLIKL